MIAIVKHVVEWVAESAKFTAAVWHEARVLQAEAEARHNHIGF